MTTALDPTTNGHGAEPAGQEPSHGPMGGGDSSLSSLRQRPENVHVLRGYGPLVVGVVLFVLMVLLAPTVAPERIVERPVDDPATTTTVEVTTTAPAATAPPTTAPGEAVAP
jgi:hypothetical protein